MSPFASTRALLALGALLAVLPAWSADPADAPVQNWSAHLEADVRAFHAALRDSHPGPVDPENPAFAGLLDAGLQRALERVPETGDYAGYWWALREFQAAFDDGHVQLGSTDAAPALTTRWPGFLTAERNGSHVVAVRDDLSGVPPQGAVLSGCDGIDADVLARAQVGRFRGNWSLAAQRARHAGRLFLDAGNPWAPPPRTCRFVHAGIARDYALTWEPLTDERAGALLRQTQASHATTTGLRAHGDQLWISMASFNGNSGNPAFAEMTALVAALDDAARVGGAARVVLDVRGNGGGSSHWSYEIATRLWGDAAIKALPRGGSEVDWRVSQGNLDAMRAFQAMLQGQEAPNPQMLQWADVIVGGIAGALADGRALWRQPGSDAAGELDALLPPRAPALAPAARVFVLADAACASACLDALDLWLPLGAVLVGGETSADTVYMDVREQALPGGLSRAWIPMKVYRGRSRGNNVPYVPAHAWSGDFADDAALAAWIDGL